MGRAPLVSAGLAHVAGWTAGGFGRPAGPAASRRFDAARTPIDLPNIFGALRVKASALLLVWRAIIQPLLPFAVAVAFVAGVASAVIVTALHLVLPERSIQR